MTNSERDVQARLRNNIPLKPPPNFKADEIFFTHNMWGGVYGEDDESAEEAISDFYDCFGNCFTHASRKEMAARWRDVEDLCLGREGGLDGTDLIKSMAFAHTSLHRLPRGQGCFELLLPCPRHAQRLGSYLWSAPHTAFNSDIDPTDTLNQDLRPELLNLYSNTDEDHIVPIRVATPGRGAQPLDRFMHFGAENVEHFIAFYLFGTCAKCTDFYGLTKFKFIRGKRSLYPHCFMLSPRIYKRALLDRFPARPASPPF